MTTYQTVIIEQTRRYGDRWAITGTRGGKWDHPSVLRVVPYGYLFAGWQDAREGVELHQSLACVLPGCEYKLVGAYWE